MEEKLQPKKSKEKPLEENTLLPKDKKITLEMLKNMPYSNERVGQGFIMNWKKSSEETKNS